MKLQTWLLVVIVAILITAVTTVSIINGPKSTVQDNGENIDETVENIITEDEKADTENKEEKNNVNEKNEDLKPVFSYEFSADLDNNETIENVRAEYYFELDKEIKAPLKIIINKKINEFTGFALMPNYNEPNQLVAQKISIENKPYLVVRGNTCVGGGYCLNYFFRYQNENLEYIGSIEQARMQNLTEDFNKYIENDTITMVIGAQMGYTAKYKIKQGNNTDITLELVK